MDLVVYCPFSILVEFNGIFVWSFSSHTLVLAQDKTKTAKQENLSDYYKKEKQKTYVS